MSSAGTQPGRVSPLSHLPGGRLVADLLHALNQPVTGLQCSLELAAVATRPPAEYARTIHDALQLTARIRVLVEALREIAGSACQEAEPARECILDEMLFEAVDQLRPVGDAKGIHLLYTGAGPLAAHAPVRRIERVLFRLLESGITLAREKSDVQVSAEAESGSALLALSWMPGVAPEFSPWSSPELGLLIAQAEWEHSGGQWTWEFANQRETCRLRIQLSPRVASQMAETEEEQ